MNPAPAIVLELVERFRANRASYRAEPYNETQVRLEFINPFFKALGWDMDNEQGYAEAYKDIIHEDAIKVGGATKAPDYCFRIGGARKFFVEAKKPAVNIHDDAGPAYQLRRYAWSARLPLSILTDFEELAVYDCRVRPKQGDKAGEARVLWLTYDDYSTHWSELAAIFSKEAMLKGSFDRYVEDNKAKHGTQAVDDAFLAEIEGWRDELARNLALRNPGLAVRELNWAVQATIDRIIFLRMAEDRGLEPYSRLLGLLPGAEVYPRLVQLYHQADARYNSGLFHFVPEKGRDETPDTLTPNLKLDDKLLRQIIEGLYYPSSPYEFSMISGDILGQVYERFLGKVIRLTAGHQAKVEEKPEVRKAGGVYYTPGYIVEYIVRHTVGALLEGRTPRDLRTPLRVLDPACGSGSFLLGAYRYLLDWHLEGYVREGAEKHAKGSRPRLARAPSGDWRLTTAERKRILLDHIYGVDIDPQAVEVTKLSLLLKVLEGETEQSLATQLGFWKERALPDLARNIQCGNSLIGPDYYQGRQASFLDEDELYRVNPFDWQAAFPQVFVDGGFDAVIGNPPYIRIQTLKEWAPLEVELYKQHYRAASKGNYDIYVVFVEKGLALLNAHGRLGFILPHKFMNAQYGEPLRALIAAGRHLAEVVHFGDQQVFSGATTYTCLMFLDKAGAENCHVVRVENLTAWRAGGEAQEGEIATKQFGGTAWNLNVGNASALLDRLMNWPTKVRAVTSRIAQGIRTSANEVYVVDLVEDRGEILTARSAILDEQVMLERDVVASFLQGREIKPYRVLSSGKLIIIPYHIEGDKIHIIPEIELRQKFPHTFEYLRQNRGYLEGREHGKMQGTDWYGYVYPKNIEVMRSPKILVPDIADHASFALDPLGEYAFTSGYGITLAHDTRESIEYILGLLNSRLLDFCLKRISTTLRGGFFRYFTQYIEQLPIRTIDFGDPADVERHDRLVALVQCMLDLHQRLAAAQTPTEKTLLQRQITATDQQIDALVYELYGLTEQEIALVEGRE